MGLRAELGQWKQCQKDLLKLEPPKSELGCSRTDMMTSPITGGVQAEQEVLEPSPEIQWFGTICSSCHYLNLKSTWDLSHILWALLKPRTQNSSLSTEMGRKAKEHHESLHLPIRTQILRNFSKLLFLPTGCPPQCLGWVGAQQSLLVAMLLVVLEERNSVFWEKKTAIGKGWQ